MPCKIKACKEKHDTHHCRLCGARDEHFTLHCPKSKTRYHGTAANVVASCNIRTCKEKHDTHYCRLCGARDEHFTLHCPKSKTLYHGTAANVVASCKIKTCREKHDTHYCRLCGAKDEHFSSQCPNSETLYHGTAANVVAPITIEGFKGSTNGCLGPGVYFVEEQIQAQKIGERRGVKSAVFKCKVNLGKLKDTGTKQCSDWQHNGYDSATRMHPPWLGIIGTSFREYCLKESKKTNIVVTSIYIEGKQILKDENKTWGEATQLIQNLKPEASRQAVVKTVYQIRHL